MPTVTAVHISDTADSYLRLLYGLELLFPNQLTVFIYFNFLFAVEKAEREKERTRSLVSEASRGGRSRILRKASQT